MWVLDLSAAALLAVLDVMPPERKPKDRDILLKLRRDHSDRFKADVASVVATREAMADFAVQAALIKHKNKQRLEAGEDGAKVQREEEKKLKILFTKLVGYSETRIRSLKRKMHPSRQGGRPTKIR